jgi:hypothetical protein
VGRRLIERTVVCCVVAWHATGCTELAVVGSGGATGTSAAAGDATATTSNATTTASVTSTGTGACAATWQRTIDGAAGIEREGKLFWASAPGVARLDPCSGATLSAIPLQVPRPALFVEGGGNVLLASVGVEPNASSQRVVVEGFDPVSDLPSVAPILFDAHDTISLRAMSYDPGDARVWLGGSYTNGPTIATSGLWSTSLGIGDACNHDFERDEVVFAEIIEGKLVAVAYDGNDGGGPSRRSVVSTAGVLGCNVVNLSRVGFAFAVHAALRLGGDLYFLGEDDGAVRLERWDLTMLVREAAVTLDVGPGLDEGRAIATDGERLWIGGNAADGGVLAVSAGFVAEVPLAFADDTVLVATRFDDVRSAKVTAGREALYVSGETDGAETLLRKCTHDVVCN